MYKTSKTPYKYSLIIAITLLNASLATALEQSSDEAIQQAIEATQPSHIKINKDIDTDDSSKRFSIPSIENKVVIDNHGQKIFDGPEITLEAKISERVRGHILLALQGLFDIQHVKLLKEKDFNEFLKEATIIIDQDKSSKIPFVTIIGKQEIETGGATSGMLDDDAELMHGLNRVKKAYAIQFQMGPELLKGIDSVVVAAVNTGSGSDDTMGDNIQPASNGGLIVLTKKISDEIILSGGLSHIAFPEKAESRLNWGIVRKSKDGHNEVFFNQAIFQGNPLYTVANNAMTLGVIHQSANGKNSITLEASSVGRVKRELAIGLYRTVIKNLKAGIELRQTQCLNDDICATGTSATFVVKYSKGDDGDE